MYNYEASFFVWLTEPLYLTKFQKAAICVRDFQGVRDTTLINYMGQKSKPFFSGQYKWNQR